MDARSVLTTLRHGGVLSADDIAWFATGLANGNVTDAQAGAFAMAVCRNGLGEAGRVALTAAMRDSGDVLKWDLDGPVLDKHSTGGIGDAVSLVLAPALAACGAYVPMISGRGLGHSGGTLDKLESIVGVRTDVSTDRFREMVKTTGGAIVGATDDIAPADKRLYKIRDVTGTVDSIDLITASILSKKLAAGLNGLVLDVKVGTGAFMASRSDAELLAQSLTKTANAAGCPTTAFITDMNQPLLPAVGNALEIQCVIDVLSGRVKASSIETLSREFGAALLCQAGVCDTVDAGNKVIADAISSGQAAEVFNKMIADLGGPTDVMSTWGAVKPTAAYVADVPSLHSGWVTAMDGIALGLLVVELGGGRKVETDALDYSVGVSDVVRIADPIEKGAPLVQVHAHDETSLEYAIKTVQKAIQVSDAPCAEPELIYEKVSS